MGNGVEEINKDSRVLPCSLKRIKEVIMITMIWVSGVRVCMGKASSKKRSGPLNEDLKFMMKRMIMGLLDQDCFMDAWTE